MLDLIDAFPSRKKRPAAVYVWTNEADLAFRELAKLVNVPAGLGIRATFKADLSLPQRTAIKDADPLIPATTNEAPVVSLIAKLITNH